jgi:membrane protease YdiL (CAAX protease family)
VGTEPDSPISPAPEAALAPDRSPRPFARWLTIVGTLAVAGVFAAGIWVKGAGIDVGGGPPSPAPTKAEPQARAQRHPFLQVVDGAAVAIGLAGAGVLLARRRRPRPAPPELPAPWPRGDLYAATVRCLLWSFAVVVAIGVVMGVFKRPLGAEALTLLVYAIGWGWMVRLVFKRWGLSWRDSLVRPPAGAGADLVITTLAAIGLCRAGSVGIGLLAWLTGSRIPAADLPPPIDAASRIDLALAVAGSVIMPALVEELLFRRAIFTRLRRSLTPGRAALASALLFALPHGYAPIGLAMMIWIGLCTAWAFHRTGSLWPCVAAHAFGNAMAIWASVT